MNYGNDGNYGQNRQPMQYPQNPQGFPQQSSYPQNGQQGAFYAPQGNPYAQNNSQQAAPWNGMPNPYGGQQVYPQPNNANGYPQTSGQMGYPRQPEQNGWNNQTAPGGYGQSGAQTLYRGGYPGLNGMQRQPAYPGGQSSAQQSSQFQQPQPQPAAKPAKPLNLKPAVFVMLLLVLPTLFVLSMFVMKDVKALKWAFIAAALLTVLLAWRPRMVEANTRLTATVIYCALAVVVAVSAMSGQQQGGEQQNNRQTGLLASAGVPSGIQADNGNNEPVYTQQLMATPTPTKDPLDTDAVRQVESFFYFWSVNKTENMLGLCAPSWISSVPNPQVALFSIQQNRTPSEYHVDKISGTENDNSRTVTVTSTINKNRVNTAPVQTRFSVVVLKESGVWYVDPRSLSSSIQETDTPTPEPTITATPEVTTNPNMKLYYNSKGGTQYHLEEHCRAIHSKYYEYMRSFTWSQIDDEPYKDLQPCNICAAPLRPPEILY